MLCSLTVICDVPRGTSTLSSALKDEQVGEKVQQGYKAAAEKSKELGRKGWTGLKSLYATVASQVESAAKDSGYKIDLGMHQKDTGLSLSLSKLSRAK